MGKGIHPPEPFKEADVYYSYGRRGGRRDPYASQGSTELGWGAGLIAPCNNGQPPGPGDNPGLADARIGGGQYIPRAPRTIPPATGVGPPIQRPYGRGEVRGYPGDIIAQ